MGDLGCATVIVVFILAMAGVFRSCSEEPPECVPAETDSAEGR